MKQLPWPSDRRGSEKELATDCAHSLQKSNVQRDNHHWEFPVPVSVLARDLCDTLFPQLHSGTQGTFQRQSVQRKREKIARG
jgi:hypothetical protein